MLEGNGPKWLFDLDSLTQSMNYVPVVTGSLSNVSAEVSTAVLEINTATPEDLMGPNPTTEDTQVEDQEIELGNIS
ncbi:hypothetical protein Tco_0547339, partial [Tanacetum coccineum]